MDHESSFNPAPAAAESRRPPKPMRRRRRVLRVGAAVGATVLLAGSGLAQGQGIGTGPEVRVRGAAMGIGAHFVFSRPGSAPMEPVFDVSFGTAGGGHDQLSNQNFGFASSFYPGNTPATPGSLLGLVGFPVGGQILPPEHPIYQGYNSVPGVIPPWPLATQGSYPGNPGRRVDLLSDVTGTIPAPLPADIGGMTQETVVDEDVVTAVTNVERLAVSSVGGLNPEFEPLVAQLEAMTKPYTGGGAGVRGHSFTLKGLNARYESVTTGDAARSTAEVTVREVEVLGGLLEFFRVRSLAEYAGGPEGAKLTNHTAEIGLAKVLGLEVTFDDKGMKLADRRIPASQEAAVSRLLEQILTQAGFKVETAKAKIDGNRVEEVALRIVMAEQEPTLPGATFLGRKTTVIFEVGALTSNFETLEGFGGGSEDFGFETGDGDAGDLGVSLPEAGLHAAPAQGSSARTGSATAVPPTKARRSRGTGARPGSTGVSNSPGSVDVADAAPREPAVEEAAAALAAPGSARVLAAGPTARGKERRPQETPLVLLPGVLATDAEQREIAAGIEDVGRRMLVLAGVGVLGALVVWRRRRGILQ
jgi:hypothetical protein